MTDKQPEALRLADELDCRGMNRPSWKDQFDAGYELRRLHKENEALRARLAQPEPDDGYCQACDGNNCTAKNGCVALDSPKAQPKPEPVAWKRPVYMVEDGWDEFGFTDSSGDDVPLYTAPPQREWQGLTEYEVGFLTVFDGLHDVEVPLLANFIRHIEAKLKEKNGF